MKFKKYVRESTETNDSVNCCDKCHTIIDSEGRCKCCEESVVTEELSNTEKLKRAFPELNFDDSVKEELVTEELSNMEKLIKAYPELAEDSDISESIEEELTNLQKLKRAYPELNFEDETEPLTEGIGSEVFTLIKDTMSKLSTGNKGEWAKTVTQIMDVIPADEVDELLDTVKKQFATVKLKDSDKDKIIDASGIDMKTSEDTVGEVLDVIENRKDAKDDAESKKKLATTVLAVMSALEPTPVLEVLTGIVKVLPAKVVSGILDYVQSFNLLNRVLDAKNESISSINKTIVENYDEEEGHEDSIDEYDFDDDYYFDDDVEEDRMHAALYGGDRDYCDCGKRLLKDDDGNSYCPDCDSQSFESEEDDEEESLLDDDI